MSAATGPAHQADALSREEEMSFLFAQLVLQQSNMAMMLLGKVAHPESGKVVQDVDAARLFIDQLEMLERKTKGNLSKEEEALLKQTLMTLRLNFVEMVERASSEQTPAAKPAETPAEQTQTSESGPSTGPQASTTEEDEHRKKFSKKY